MKKIKIIFPILLIFLVFLFFLFRNELIFLKNKITGAAELDTSVVILILNESLCEFNMVESWNLISIPCIPKPINTTEILNSINDKIISVHEYNPTSNDKWRAYNPNLPEWVVQDLELFSRKKGYWINLNQSTNLTINSSTASPNLIDLVQGWNLIGYPTLNPKNITESLQSINQTYDVIYLYNSSDNSWKEYSWNSSKNLSQDLINMTPYYGYWIKMLQEDILFIDW
jgi:hypothetical protein